MTSFIELPQLGFGGVEQSSLYVNVADIIQLRAEYDGTTVLEIRDIGSEGMSVTRRTYIPLAGLLTTLEGLAKEPGVVTWSEKTRDMFRLPAQERARAAAADRERGIGHHLVSQEG